MGGCCEQEAWRSSAELFLQLESPGVLVVSVRGGQSMLRAPVVKLRGLFFWFFFNAL